MFSDLAKVKELREMATLNFACFDECLELKEIDEELFEEAWNENWSSIESWDYFERKLVEKKTKLLKNEIRRLSECSKIL